ncbi:potassium channel family protein [Actomonas aquatica]|uniref:Ion transporter n=1 Tax=Actomonas aquatica TaxID=2866162 RepID=A0ABZ1C6A2_9BACT|nr:potassium channel family protein [Opitutus sp. WL0086]WRQ87253.1 ion transporter [Opitutus sp. WL0086]
MVKKTLSADARLAASDLLITDAMQVLPPTENPEDLGPFQFGVLVLSLVLLAGLGAELVLPVPEEIQRLIFYIDTIICGLLFIDFAIRFAHAESKLRFMKWGWFDLLAAVPAIEAFRILRVVRVVRLLIVIRSFRRLYRILLESKTSAGLTGVLVLTFLVISFGSIGVLFAEHDAPNANILTANDALWWSVTTTTTVGYGDKYPVTAAGRIIATFLMVAGIGMFGTLSGVAAGIFLGGDKNEPASGEAQQQILARLEAMQTELNALRRDRDGPISKGTSPAGNDAPPPPS